MYVRIAMSYHSYVLQCCTIAMCCNVLLMLCVAMSYCSFCIAMYRYKPLSIVCKSQRQDLQERLTLAQEQTAVSVHSLPCPNTLFIYALNCSDNPII